MPDNEGNKIEVLRRLKEGKIKLKHPKGRDFKFEFARHQNLCINLRAEPPTVAELCDYEWENE